MKLDDFLKCKKVRCLSNDYDFNEQGKAYKLHGLRVFITDETGCTAFLPIEDFEPVLDSAENPLENMKLKPEFETEASEPKFKVGDRVYVGLTGRIVQVTAIIDNDVVSVANKNNEIRAGVAHICHATPENYERLQATFSDIEFEQPAKELKGSDLARALIKKGWVGFNCLCGHSGDENAITDTIVIGINNDGKFTTIDGRLFSNAIPMKGWLPLKAQEVGL